MSRDKKKVIIGCDHSALEVKAEIMSALVECEFNDVGTYDTTSCDYPDIVKKATDQYLAGGYDFGILICGTGIGVSITANKVNGIYCALVFNSFMAQMAKEHNNANFLALGARLDYEEGYEAVLRAYLGTEMTEERHLKRLQKVKDMENGV